MDLRSLLSCIRNTKDIPINQALLQDTLKTIMNMCSNTASAKDELREIGGLSCLIDFVCSTSDIESLDYGLKTLSCIVDQNEQNQNEVTKNDIFILIRNTLAREDLTPSLLKSAVLLISTILYQNAIAQNIFRETGCLKCCADLYQEVFPAFMLGHVSVKVENSDLKLASTGIWQSVNTAVCFSMTNPVNTCNQEWCARLIPVALRILQCSSYHEILSSITTFFSALIMDSGRNLLLFVKHGGLSVLKYCLEVGVMSILANKTHVESQDDVKATVCIISLIDLCIVDNEDNAHVLSESGVVSLLTKMLFIDALNDGNKTKVLLTLGHFIEAGKENIKRMLAEGNLKMFFKRNCKSSNDDLLKSSQYVIHLLLLHGQFSNTDMNGDTPVSTPNQNWKADWSITSASCITDFQAKRARLDDYASSSSSSFDLQSQIELSKTKEERVRQYVRDINNIETKSPNTHPAAIGMDKNPKDSFSPWNKNFSCFNDKFGSQQSKSHLTSSAVNTARAECSSRKSIWSFSGAGKQNTAFFPQGVNHDFPKRNPIPSPHCSRLETYKKGIAACCNRIPFSPPIFSSTPRDNKCDRNNLMCEMPDSDFFLKSTQVLSTSRSIAVQMPTPIVKSKSKDIATSTNTPAFLWQPKVSSTKILSACDNGGEKSNDQSLDNLENKRDSSGNTVRGRRFSGQSMFFSPFEKDSHSYMGSLVNVLKCSPDRGTAASRLAAKMKKQKLKHESPTFQDTSLSKSEDTEPYFDVLVFPSTKCAEHGLISSNERLWFKPIGDK